MNRRLILGISVSALVVALIIIIALLLSGDKFSLSLRTITISGDAATYTMELDLNAEWVLIATPSDWCYVDPYMGNKGRARITVEAAANPHQEARETKLTFYSGNAMKDFVLKQLPGSQRTVVTPPVVQPQPVAPATVKPKPQPRTVTAAKPKPVVKPQPRAVAQPKPKPAAKSKPVQAKQEKTTTVEKVVIQPDVFQGTEQAKEEPAKREPARVKASIASPCTPVESFVLTATANFVCNGESVGFSLSGSQPSISYQLFRDGRPVSGFVPGKGGEIAFPDRYLESGVYTAKSVAVASYCATDMQGNINITVAEKFNPGKIVPYTEKVVGGNIPSPIKSAAPARGGDGKVHYQWCINGRFIEGANGETYQPAAVTYSCTYTRMAHEESCNVPWEPSTGQAVVAIERK